MNVPSIRIITLLTFILLIFASSGLNPRGLLILLITSSPLVGALFVMAAGRRESYDAHLVATALVALSGLGVICLWIKFPIGITSLPLWGGLVVLDFKINRVELTACILLNIIAVVAGLYLEMTPQKNFWEVAILLPLAYFGVTQMVLGYSLVQVLGGYQVVSACIRGYLYSVLEHPVRETPIEMVEVCLGCFVGHAWYVLNTLRCIELFRVAPSFTDPIISICPASPVDVLAGCIVVAALDLALRLLNAVPRIWRSLQKGGNEGNTIGVEAAYAAMIGVMGVALLFVSWKFKRLLILSAIFGGGFGKLFSGLAFLLYFV